ncbi:amidohydrolase [Bordetella sp. N]|uniref:amidohydrolase family protein n=1 Tax=Bordetella sp. N TaxID=1746199 RepID=UPI000A655BFA|nr:amidohydrolase family protein [Bordetella sp. N]
MNQTQQKVVDSHAHIYRANLPMVDGRRYSPDVDAPLADYLNVLKALGATRAVLVQPSFLGTDNTFLLQAVREARDWMRAVVVVEPEIALSELQAMARDGAVGIRLNLLGKLLPDLAHARWDPLLEFVRTNAWHVELHCEAGRLQQLMEPLLARGCQIVVDHFGRPDLGLGAHDPGFQYLLSTAATGSVWVKVSAAYRVGPGPDGGAQTQSLLDAVLHAFSADRLVWGSDWPHSQHPEAPAPARLLADFCRRVSDAGAREKILWHSPNTLFHFDRCSPHRKTGPHEGPPAYRPTQGRPEDKSKEAVCFAGFRPSPRRSASRSGPASAGGPWTRWTCRCFRRPSPR